MSQVRYDKAFRFVSEVTRAARAGGDDQLTRLTIALADLLEVTYTRGFWDGVRSSREQRKALAPRREHDNVG